MVRLESPHPYTCIIIISFLRYTCIRRIWQTCAIDQYTPLTIYLSCFLPQASPTIPPISNLASLSFLRLPCFCIPKSRMKFKRGDAVEVQINEYGFESSYYRATVVSYCRMYQCYKVRFNDLLEENEIDPLTQYAEEEHMRPIPVPPPSFHTFQAGDVVDAEDRDGWWVGRVLRRVADLLLLSFPDHNEEMYVEESCVRLHQDYVEDGDLWVYTKQ